MINLAGKNAIITGASRGIGREIAFRLAKEGVHLLLAARSVHALTELKTELTATFHVPIHTLDVDLSKAQECERLIRNAESVLGNIDILINNAGMIEAADYQAISPALIEQLINLNLTAPMLLTRYVLPLMHAHGFGRIVNMSSVSGLLPVGWMEVYATTKHGLVGFTRSLRASLRISGSPVKVSLICPIFVEDTGMYTDRSQADGRKAPKLVGTCSSDEVVHAVLRGLKFGAAESVVANVAVRWLCATYNLSPVLGDWAMQLTRVHHAILNHVRKLSQTS